MRVIYNKNFKASLFFIKKLPGVTEGVAKAFNSISKVSPGVLPLGYLPTTVDYVGRIMTIPVAAELFTNTSIKNAQQEVKDIITSLGGVSQADPYYATHMPKVIEKVSSVVIRVFQPQLPALTQFSTALYTNVALIEAQLEHGYVPEQMLNVDNVANMAFETIPEKAGRKLAPLLAMIRRPFLAITDNMLIRAVGDFLGSPTVANISAVVGAAIVLKAAIGAGLTGTIVIAGVQLAAPIAVAIAVTSIVSIGLTTWSKARRVQKARNKELEYRAVEEIEHSIKIINEKLKELEKTDHNSALFLSEYIDNLSADSSIDKKYPIFYYIAVEKTMLGGFAHYATTIFTTVVTISTVPVAAAFTALSTILGIISDMGNKINRQLAIDAESIAIGQKVDNMLRKLGEDVGKLHGVERTKAVLKMANKIKAEKIAMDRVIAIMQNMYSAGMVNDGSDAKSLFLQYKKEEMDKLDKERPIKTISLLSSYIQTAFTDLSVRWASTVEIPVCTPARSTTNEPATTTRDSMKNVKNFEQKQHINEEKQKAVQKIIAAKTSSYAESVLSKKSRNSQASRSRG